MSIIITKCTKDFAVNFQQTKMKLNCAWDVIIDFMSSFYYLAQSVCINLTKLINDNAHQHSLENSDEITEKNYFFPHFLSGYYYYCFRHCTD